MLLNAVPAYLDYLRANKGDAAAVQLTLARAEKLRLENDLREKEVVKTTDGLEVFRVAITAWRDEASKIPQRVAGRIAKSKRPDEISRILRDELDGIYGAVEKPFQAHFGATWDSPAAGK